MKYRKFGKSHMDVSEIGFGAWAIGGSWGEQKESDSLEALKTAIDEGVNFIDTAAGYGKGKSERIVGEFLKTRPERIYVCTKTPPKPGNWPPSPYDDIEERYPEKYLRESIEERLKNLQLESLDILLLHTWTRAWNDNPKALETLQKIKSEGLIKNVGMSTPVADQNVVVQLMRTGLLDAVQVIFNIFQQEPVAQLLPVAQETGTGIIVRVPFDEGVLTGKFTGHETFPEDDFRIRYFAGDRLQRSVERTNAIKEEFKDNEFSMAELALKFSLSHEAVSTVIPGIRNKEQAKINTGVSDKRNLTEEELEKLHKHHWKRAFWYAGK